MISTEEIRFIQQLDVRAMIREICEDDAARLLEYYRCLAREPVNNTSIRPDVLQRTVGEQRALIHRHFSATHSKVFAAHYDDRIIGVIKCLREDHPLMDHVVEISINVHPQFRGLGIGSALLRHALDWARQEQGITRVQLEVLTRNQAAVRLYERLGFVCEGMRRRAYYFHDEGHDAYEDAIVMGLLLPLEGGA